MQNLLSSSLQSKNLKIKMYRIIILPVVLYGCETRSFTLREERSVRVFENRLLRRIFGSRRDEVTGEWRKLLSGELMICIITKYYMGYQIEKNEMSRACSTYGGEMMCIQYSGRAL